MKGVPQAAGVEVENRAPNGLGVVVLARVHRDGKSAPVDGGEIMTEMVGAGVPVLGAGEIHADHAASGGMMRCG